MQSKYNPIRERLKKHMECANGLKAWNVYHGSQLEADIIRFIEKELNRFLADQSDYSELITPHPAHDFSTPV